MIGAAVVPASEAEGPVVAPVLTVEPDDVLTVVTPAPDSMSVVGDAKEPAPFSDSSLVVGKLVLSLPLDMVEPEETSYGRAVKLSPDESLSVFPAAAEDGCESLSPVEVDELVVTDEPPAVSSANEETAGLAVGPDRGVEVVISSP